MVAVIALIVAMSGTSYAVSQLPRNSVGAKQLKRNAVSAVKIKKNAVTAAKIKNNAVTSAKIKDGTIAASDLSAQARAELQGATGATGATGPQGATGAQGPAGPSASTSAGSTTAVLIIMNPVTVIDTAPSRNLTVDTASRLVITAFANIDGDSFAWDDRNTGVSCFPQVATTTGQAINVNDNGYATIFPYATTQMMVSLPIVNTADVDPGTYRVWIQCDRSTPVGMVTFEQGNLAVVATAR